MWSNCMCILITRQFKHSLSHDLGINELICGYMLIWCHVLLHFVHKFCETNMVYRCFQELTESFSKNLLLFTVKNHFTSAVVLAYSE